MKNTDNTVGTVTSCVYAHVFSDKSVYVGAGKYVGERDSDFTPRNDTYAEKLEKYGDPVINIIDTFNTSDGDYKVVFEREREAFMLLEDMNVEMVNECRPTGVANPYWSGEEVRKRVEDGTHHFLAGAIQRETNRKRVEDGTHNWLGGDIQRETQRRRVNDGTHNFLSGDIQRETNRKRVEDGTHHLLSGDIQRDWTLYTFECFQGIDAGKTFVGVRSDFYAKYPYVNKGNMCNHIRGVGYFNGANGWRLKNN